MKSNTLKAAIFGAALAFSAGTANAQDQASEGDQLLTNLFNSTAQSQGGTTNWNSLGAMFSTPDNTPKFNLATPNGWSVFMNPLTYAQMMNPATYAQMLSPAFYMQFINPQNWLSWFNPTAYSNWFNPQTYLQSMNPVSYLPYVNPLTYLAPVNPYNYAPYIDPQTYTQWFNPTAYSFSAQQQAAQAAGQNWFNPETWTQELEKSE